MVERLRRRIVRLEILAGLSLAWLAALTVWQWKVVAFVNVVARIAVRTADLLLSLARQAGGCGA
jgi:hypothetical protein